MILDGTTGGRWTGSSTPTARPSRGHERVTVADDLDDVAVEQDAAVLGSWQSSGIRLDAAA